MQQSSNSPSMRRVVLVSIAIVVALVAIMVFIQYATHGKLVVEHANQLTGVAYQPLSSTHELVKATPITGGHASLKPGDYQVTAEQDGANYVRKVHVQGFGHSSSVSFSKQPEALLSRIATSKDDYYVPLGGGFVSFNNRSEYFTVHAANDPFDQNLTLRQYDPSLIVDQVVPYGTKVLMIASDIQYQDDGGLWKLYLYDPVDSSYKLLKSPAFDTSDSPTITTNQANDSFILSLPAKQTAYYFKDTTTSGVKIGNSKLSASEGGLQIALNGDSLVYLTSTTKKQKSTDDSVESTVDPGSYTAHIYDTDNLTRERAAISLPVDVQVSQTAISSDGSQLALTNNAAIYVYKLAKNAQLLSSLRYDTIKDLYWTTSNNVIFTAAHHSVISLNPSSGEAQPLVALPNATIGVAHLLGNKLYFSAPDKRHSYDFDNAYALDLTTKSTDNNQVLTVVPYKSDNVTFTMLDNTIYVSTKLLSLDLSQLSQAATIQQKAVADAKNYLKQRVKHLDSYTVIYSNQ